MPAALLSCRAFRLRGWCTEGITATSGCPHLRPRQRPAAYAHGHAGCEAWGVRRVLRAHSAGRLRKPAELNHVPPAASTANKHRSAETSYAGAEVSVTIVIGRAEICKSPLGVQTHRVSRSNATHSSPVFHRAQPRLRGGITLARVALLMSMYYH